MLRLQNTQQAALAFAYDHWWLPIVTGQHPAARLAALRRRSNLV
jgi:hypothetical protein